MIHKFCDSHYISRFAAFFIDARAKRSFVESFDFIDKSDTVYSINAGPKTEATILTPHGLKGRRP